MRCSKRWAKPVLPGFSFFEPTWYQTFTAAIGALWSSWTIKVRPLPSTYFWNDTSGMGMSADAGAASAAAGRAASTRTASSFRVMVTSWDVSPVEDVVDLHVDVEAAGTQRRPRGSVGRS